MDGDVPEVQRDGGGAAVDALVDAGVDVAFGIPASHVIEVYDALGTATGIRTVIGRNEQNCAYMADGFARRARRPGVAVVTGGPGLGHTVTGLQTAYADSSPVVVVASDLDPAQRAAVPAGVPHETVDSAALAASTGATVTRADAPDEVRSAVLGAVAATGRGRHRPSVCLLSRAALSGSPAAAVRAGDAPAAVETPAIPGAVVDTVRRMLRAARDPVVLAGAGIGWAGAERLLERFLRVAGLRCLTTVPARSVLDDASPHWAGVLDDDRSRALLGGADFVLAIGTGFGWASTGGGRLRLPPGLVHVDRDPREIGRCYQPALGIVADAADFLDAVLAGWSDPVRPVGRPAGPGRRPHPWVDAISAALPAGPCSVLADVSTTTRWLARSLRCGPDRRFFLPWNSMSMGWSFPAALGVQAAAPDEPVLAVLGDGGALFCLGELATAVENDLPVCLLVVNNRSYGVIGELQDAVCGGRRFGVELRTPDFPAVARAFGIPAWTARSPTELSAALRAALAAGCPTVVEAVVEPAAFADLPARRRPEER